MKNDYSVINGYLDRIADRYYGSLLAPPGPRADALSAKWRAERAALLRHLKKYGYAPPKTNCCPKEGR